VLSLGYRIAAKLAIHLLQSIEGSRFEGLGVGIEFTYSNLDTRLVIPEMEMYVIVKSV